MFLIQQNSNCLKNILLFAQSKVFAKSQKIATVCYLLFIVFFEDVSKCNSNQKILYHFWFYLLANQMGKKTLLTITNFPIILDKTGEKAVDL